ncbi:uncharacterized protein LOC132991999 [Labrus mixtus]|uniref:uncharacterized protein LOC132991999 n=1 Tax=Labrus mixtus TaxID=508554 RepID=UPI0029BFEEC1|nr:uncharacterized protein LOC132991999 [Labrus mixtus]
MSAFLCLLDSQMLQHIRDCTVVEARRIEADSSWDLSIAELKAFIALLYVRGAYNKNIELESFWSEEWGLAFFRATMPRNRFRKIIRYLSFDKKHYKQAKFALTCDEMFTVQGATGRWPVSVFYNLLDMAAVNAHVLFKACTSTTIPRRAFILQLAKELREEHLHVKASLTSVPTEPQQPKETKRRQCQINTNCKQNKTLLSCKGCKRPLCGKCTVRVEHFCPWCVR